ncbi:MAG: 3'(2'),5'-bisphosphate nucleotidase CysQ [Crocinitomix sp.]|nr:3'(2'),5'-bisphosphate nucleotidase CysQ [Crocinitomix sp.]
MIEKEIHRDWITTAVAAAIEASAAILEVYQAGFEVTIKADRSPVTLADKTSSRIICKHLESTGIQVMSEEEEASTYIERQKQEYIWIVDPMDGTKEFIAKNGEFCICIALVKNGKPIFGLIAAPIDQTILLGGNEMGAYYFDYETVDFLNETYKVPKLSINPQKTIAHSRSHFSEKGQRMIDSITEKYGAPKFIKKGSALKFIDLVLGKADFYPRLAPTMEWDIAAGQAIYESVGGEVLDFTNFEPLEYNKENLYNPFFIAKNKELNI